jgi:hypothetical protein
MTGVHPIEPIPTGIHERQVWGNLSRSAVMGATAGQRRKPVIDAAAIELAGYTQDGRSLANSERQPAGFGPQ